MEQLTFRARDVGPGFNRWQVVLPLAPLAVRMVTLRHMTWSVSISIAVFLVVFLGLVLGSRQRCWTRVGPEGIRLRWLLGRGRLIPWDQVRSVQLRPYRGGAANVVVLRPDGHKVVLPGLATTTAVPDPELPQKLAQVTAWWLLCTDEADRLDPAVAAAPTRRRIQVAWRRSGAWQGLVALLVAVVTLVPSAAQLADAVSAADAYRRLPVCHTLRAPGCRSRIAVDVGGNISTADRFQLSTLTFGPPATGGDPSAGVPVVAYFGSTASWVRDLRFGQPVTVESGPNGKVTTLIDGGRTWTTLDHPDAEVGYAEGQLAPGVVLFLLFAAWSLALLLARRSRRVVRFRWWVPLLGATLVPVAVVAQGESDWAAPLLPADYLPTAATLAAGLAATALIGVLRGRTGQD